MLCVHKSLDQKFGQGWAGSFFCSMSSIGWSPVWGPTQQETWLGLQHLSGSRSSPGGLAISPGGLAVWVLQLFPQKRASKRGVSRGEGRPTLHLRLPQEESQRYCHRILLLRAGPRASPESRGEK